MTDPRGENPKYTIYTRHPDDGVVKSAVMMWEPELLAACSRARDWIAANAGQTESAQPKEEILAVLKKAINRALTQH